jgi:sugar lactone lactonase YvrE
VALVEAYDLDRTVDSKLANISTRGQVQTADNVMIGGLIVLGQSPLRVILRAIGPSLNVPGKLADPTLELRDSMGALIRANDNWRSDQQAEIIATGIPPTNDLESAIVQNLAPGNYTAIVRGVNNTTGVALVEAYGLGVASPTPTPSGSATPTPAGSPTPTPAGTPTPTPTPKLFIVNAGDLMNANTMTVTTSNLDGTGGTSLGNIGNFLNIPQGIAINATAGKIYVSSEGGASVTQSNLDGSSPVNLTFNGLLNGPYGVALDVPGNRMFVANGGNNTIVRANLDGSNATNLGNLGGLLAIPQGMAINVAGNKMYVANQNGTITQANLDGTGGVSLNLGGLLTGTIPLDVTLNVAGNRIYVVDFNGKVFTADLNGNNAMMISTAQWQLMAPRGIGLDVTGGKMYVSNSMNSTVTRADLPDGANPTVLTIATVNTPAVVAVYRAP